MSCTYKCIIHLCGCGTDSGLSPESGSVRRSRALGTVFILLSLAIGSQAFPQKYNYRNFNAGNGLDRAYIYTLIQDARGYLWLGTGQGLSRYNGFYFEDLPIPGTREQNLITCSIRDGENLWFGTYDGGLIFYNGKEFRTVNPDSLNPSPVTCLAKDQDGIIWAGTYSAGLLRLSGDSGIVKRYRFRGQAILTNICFIDKTLFLAGTNSGLLFCSLEESDEIKIIRNVDKIPASRITCVRQIRNGSGFYVATENDGLFRLKYKNDIFTSGKIVAEGNLELYGLQYIFEDSRSYLWLCTFGRGLIRLNCSASGEAEDIIYFDKASGFSSNDIKTVYEDREGNIWSGNYGQGLTMIVPETISLYRFKGTLLSNNILSVCADAKYIWLGTEDGLVQEDGGTGRLIRFYGTNAGLPEDKITAVYSGGDGYIWIGTGESGIYLLDAESKKITRYGSHSGTLENSITAIAGTGNDIWIGTQKGLLDINSANGNERWYSISRGGLPHNFINGLFADREGRLWITTPTSIISYISNERVFRIPVSSQKGNMTLGPVTEDSASRIWTGSNGSGVFILEKDSIANLTTKEGLVSDYCSSLISDGTNVWVGHMPGLSRIRTEDFWIKQIRRIDSLDNNFMFNRNSVTKDKSGKVWFGSDKGLICHDPSMENQSYLPPVLGITSIRINGEEAPVTGRIVLPPGNYKVSFDFLGLNLKEPGLVTYLYKMEGYDQSSEITTNRNMTYSHLSDGDFTFLLKASSGDGAVTEKPLKVSIHIIKPVWEHWWFYLLLTIAVVALIYTYIKRREYKFLEERRILEEKVRERTSEIECQKNEIEVQKNMIDEQNARLTSSIIYASNIQNAVLPSERLARKLFNDHFILSLPKDIVSGDFFWLAEKNGKVIFSVADCTGHGVPGAFMSLLGIAFLNEIVNHHGLTASDEIVNELKVRVIDALQNRKDVFISDGLDLALCVLDKKGRKIQYTGGMNDIILFRGNEMSLIKADKISVCASYDDTGLFTMKEINYRKGDILYLYTDGYQDQFGGEFDKKFLPAHFHLTLKEIHRYPMAVQKQILEQKLNEWMKETVQTDDITVVGIRL